MLEAMRAGVTECVQEPLTPEALGQAIRRVVSGERQPDTRRSGVRVRRRQGRRRHHDAGGEHRRMLARAARWRVLLIDLHIGHGDAAVLLGVEPRFSVIDALENVHRVDESFFKGLVEKTKAGIDLLGSSDRILPAAHRPAAAPRAARFRRAHDTATRCWTFRARTWRCSTSWNASTVVLVTNQELPSLRSAGRLAQTLRTRYGAARVKAVMNRFDRTAEIGARRHRAGHRRHGQALIPSDYRDALVDAMNAGRPVVLDQSRAGRRVSGDGRRSGRHREAAACRAEQRRVRTAGVPAGVRRTMMSIATVSTPTARTDSQSDSHGARYQALKGRVHQELLNRLNLDRLTKVSRADAEPEIRGVIAGILDRESATLPLSLFERETLIVGRARRAVRPRAARAAAEGPVDLGHPRQSRRPDLHRARRTDRGDRHRLPRRQAPDADHRADRQRRRPAHRRVEPDGRCPPAGRLARQRDHPAAGARRAGDVDPPLPHRSARRQRSRRTRIADRADARLPQGCGRRAAEHHRLGRHRRRQDDAAQRALELHLRITSGSSPSRTPPS